ncbi:MAG: hypothetical protein ACK4YT_07190 [Sphingomonas sp.]
MDTRARDGGCMLFSDGDVGRASPGVGHFTVRLPPDYRHAALQNQRRLPDRHGSSRLGNSPRLWNARLSNRFV